MVTYQQINDEMIARDDDDGRRTFISVDPSSYDYRQALADFSNGATLLPASPEPIIYSGSRQLDVRVRTTNATATELFRAPLSPMTGYVALLTLVGVDAGNGALRMIRASIVAKRLSNGAALVGAPVVIANHQDAAASTWSIAANAVGNDFVITVAGAASRNVDWLLGGTVQSFTPGGQP